MIRVGLERYIEEGEVFRNIRAMLLFIWLLLVTFGGVHLSMPAMFDIIYQFECLLNILPSCICPN